MQLKLLFPLRNSLILPITDHNPDSQFLLQDSILLSISIALFKSVFKCEAKFGR
jgi:hypothetical protein